MSKQISFRIAFVGFLLVSVGAAATTTTSARLSSVSANVAAKATVTAAATSAYSAKGICTDPFDCEGHRQ